MLAVGTPGRLAELSREGVLQTHRTPALVLDEVDQLLSPHFRADLSRILEHTGVLVTSWLSQSVLFINSSVAGRGGPAAVAALPGGPVPHPGTHW